MKRFEYFVKLYFFSSFLTQRRICMCCFVRDRIIPSGSRSAKGYFSLASRLLINRIATLMSKLLLTFCTGATLWNTLQVKQSR